MRLGLADATSAPTGSLIGISTDVKGLSTRVDANITEIAVDEKRLSEIEAKLVEVFARPMLMREYHDDLFEVYGLVPMGPDREREEYLVGTFFKREVAEYFVESVEAMRQLIEAVKVTNLQVSALKEAAKEVIEFCERGGGYESYPGEPVAKLKELIK